MNAIDLSPLYRNSVGFDRLASLLNSALTNDHVSSGYPPYNIEVLDDNQYAITLAVAGFDRSELDIKVDNGVLIVKGDKKQDSEHRYLHQGIAYRAFERKFNLADYIEVAGAQLENGLLMIRLVKEIPEAMKPKVIPIKQQVEALEHKVGDAEVMPADDKDESTH
ncbi:Hsp20 family protein [Pontibacterium sp.]|uniref:Hsp20 family protein n=1 Tax=Pontibacterium sp. TaxID=2036026 RepID=UPI00351488F3